MDEKTGTRRIKVTCPLVAVKRLISVEVMQAMLHLVTNQSGAGARLPMLFNVHIMLRFGVQAPWAPSVPLPLHWL